MAITGLSKPLQPILKLYLADNPDATFNDIMNRMAFIGDSIPLDETDPEETSLYTNQGAQKGILHQGGSKYYALQPQEDSKLKNGHASYPGRWTEGIDEKDQFLSLLQSLNDSVRDMKVSNDKL